MILKDQLSCIINGGTSTQFSNLERGTRQRDLISAELFKLTLEISFLFIKKKSRNKKYRNISSLSPLYFCRQYDVFPERLTIHCIPSWNIQYFYLFPGLKSNLKKWEIVGIEALKGVQLAFCDMKCIDLRNEAIKILCTWFSYSNKRKDKSNFLKAVSNAQTLRKLWRF